MGQQCPVMSAAIEFDELLPPMLSEIDDARIALAAARRLESPTPPAIDVVPLTASSTLGKGTLYAVLGDPVHWYAVRLLIQQGKLPVGARVAVRVFLNAAQWQHAGAVARQAERANVVEISSDRPRRTIDRAAARQWAARDLVRYLPSGRNAISVPA